MPATPFPGPVDLYDAAPCGLLVADGHGRILHANGTLCRWLDYDLQALSALKWQDLLTSGGRIFHLTHLAPLLRMQGSVAEVKLEMRRSDGKSLPMMVNLAERDWEGTILLHVAVFVAEDRHKYEQELLRQRMRAEELAQQHARDQEDLAAARAEAMDRAQLAEQMVGIVSHDLRNPLSVVSMSALLLQKYGLDGRQAPVVARVARSAQVAERLISDLLDFTQARVGRGIQVVRKPVDLHEVVRDSVYQLAAAFPEHTLLHEQDGTGACEADADRISQAVGNLVGNAARYGTPRAPITISSHEREGLMRVRVHNEGREIPPEVVPVLFDPMVRGAHTGGTRGVGLGLYIVHQIALAHGGSVGVESAAGKGTAFTISFPPQAAASG